MMGVLEELSLLGGFLKWKQTDTKQDINLTSKTGNTNAGNTTHFVAPARALRSFARSRSPFVSARIVSMSVRPRIVSLI